MSIDPQIANRSQVGAKLTELRATLPIPQVSEAYTVKLTDNLMQIQLNQMILNSLTNALQSGV